MIQAITIIACVDKQFGIGKDNKLLFRLPKDMQHFKKQTEHHAVLMGRNTFDSLGQNALPNRINALISTTAPSFVYKDVLVYRSLTDALRAFGRIPEDYHLYVIGGEQLYNEAVKYADDILLTHVDASVDADTHFPMLDDTWLPQVIEEFEDTDKISGNTYKCKIVRYLRKTNDLHIGLS